MEIDKYINLLSTYITDTHTIFFVIGMMFGSLMGRTISSLLLFMYLYIVYSKIKLSNSS